MKSLFEFPLGLWLMPIWVRIWVAILLLANGIVPFMFLDRPESMVIFGTMMGAAMLMMMLTALQGFTRLLGLGHFVWFALLWYLWTRLPHIPASDSFGVWIRAVMVLNTIALVMDVVDVARWIRGEREEVVEMDR